MQVFVQSSSPPLSYQHLIVGVHSPYNLTNYSWHMLVSDSVTGHNMWPPTVTALWLSFCLSQGKTHGERKVKVKQQQVDIRATKWFGTENGKNRKNNEGKPRMAVEMRMSERRGLHREEWGWGAPHFTPSVVALWGKGLSGLNQDIHSPVQAQRAGRGPGLDYLAPQGPRIMGRAKLDATGG